MEVKKTKSSYNLLWKKKLHIWWYFIYFLSRVPFWGNFDAVSWCWCYGNVPRQVSEACVETCQILLADGSTMTADSSWGVRKHFITDKITVKKLHSHLALFSRDGGQASAHCGSGPVSVEAAWWLSSWGSQMELVEESGKEVSLSQTSPARFGVLMPDSDA